MNSQEIPEDVRAFLRRCIETYEQLEVLLLVFKEPERQWSRSELATRLKIPDEAVSDALRRLLAEQLVLEDQPRDSFRYAPGTEVLRGSVERLARSYDESLLELMKLMSANAIERLRTAAIHTFADAFILRKKDG